MRVASRLWWASRKVVSVTATSVASRSDRAKPAGPSASSRSRHQAAAGRPASRASLLRGRTRVVTGPLGRLTVTSARKVSSFVARSALTRAESSSGRSSMNDVVARPSWKTGSARTASRNGMLVETPRMRNSASARWARRTAIGKVIATARELDEHRVEVGADLGADEDGAAVEAHAAAAGGAVDRDGAGVGTEAVGGVLRRDAALQREALGADVVLAQPHRRERVARCDLHLHDDEVDVGDLLGDRVLDLDARVHLDEDVAAVLAEEELDGAGVDVADRAGERDGVGTHAGAGVGIEVGRRRDLDDLLVAALERAVALVEVHDLAGAVREHLDLDVPRVDDGLLEVERRVAEGGLGLALGGLERRRAGASRVSTRRMPRPPPPRPP